MHKDIKVNISPELNAFAIISTVSKAIRDKDGTEASEAFVRKAFACPSHEALLDLCSSTVTLQEK